MTELVGSQAFVLAEQVDYAPGSVVSRTMLRKPTGTITLFAFDRGQGLSEHTAPFDALVQIVDGVAALTVGGKQIAAKAGEIVLFPAGIPHAVQADERFKMLLVMIRS